MKKLFVLLILSTAIVSCKKNDNKNSCTTDMASIAGAYTVTAYTYKENPSATEEDFFSMFLPCEKDDIITFNSNGSFTYADAGVACSNGGDDSYTGTWSVSGNSINMDGATGTLSYDCKTLKVSLNGWITTGDEAKITFTRQ